MNDPRPDMQEPLHQSRCQNTPPTKSTSDRNSYLDIQSLLNTPSQDHHHDPASVILSTEHKQSYRSNTVEGCIKTLPCKAPIPKFFSRATHQPSAISCGNIDGRTLLIALDDFEPAPIVPQLPTSQNEPLSELWPVMNTWSSSEGTTQLPAKTSHSASRTPFMSTTPVQTSPNSIQCGGTKWSPQNNTPNSEGSSSARTVQQDVMHDNVSRSLGQNPASDSVHVRLNTYNSSLDVLVDIHTTSKSINEKRRQNAWVLMCSRREKDKASPANIDKLSQQANVLERRIKEIEEERNFYRKEAVRLADEIRHFTQAPNPLTTQSTTLSSQQAGAPSFIGPTGPQERAPKRRRTDATGNLQVYRTQPL